MIAEVPSMVADLGSLAGAITAVVVLAGLVVGGVRSSVRSVVRAELAPVDARLTAHMKGEDAQRQLDAVDRRHQREHLDGRLDRIDERLGVIDARLAEGDEELGALDHRVTTIEAAIANHPANGRIQS